ncbi:MAG: hypothetical protein GY803_07975, partial [Chloroflexi bacterium]|nr:hypothetical protein [Chloroflexota bacterium]
MTTTNRHVFIFALNLSVGLLFCFLIFPILMESSAIQLDPDGYGRVGQTLFEEGTFDTVAKAPLYPAFVAAVSFLAGKYSVTAVQVAQCLLLAVSCVVVYDISLRTLDQKIARWAGTICAIFPMLI